MTTFTTDEGSFASTTSSSVTSSSHPDEVSYYFRIGIYPDLPLRSLRLRVGWDSEWAEYMVCDPVTVAGNPEATVTVVSDGATDEIEVGFGVGGLQQSQRLLRCYTSIWHGEAWWNPLVEIVEARGADDQLVDVSGLVCLDCGSSQPRNWGAPPLHDYDACGSNVCGDAVGDGVLNATDALALLKTAVGDKPKYIQRHDVDRSGQITAIDALAVLRRAVALPAQLYCEEPPAADCSIGYVTTTTVSTTTTLP